MVVIHTGAASAENKWPELQVKTVDIMWAITETWLQPREVAMN